MTKTIFTIFLLAFLFITTLNAQTPIEVDATGLTINHVTYQDYITFNLTTVGSDNVTRNFNGRGVFNYVANCSSCRIPATLTSDGYNWQNSGGFWFDAGNPVNPNTPKVKFIVTDSESDPVVLRPTILRKKKEINIIGNTGFRGRLEIRHGSNNSVLFYDNDVDLRGQYFMKFFQIISTNYRLADFRYYTYTLTKPQQ